MSELKEDDNKKESVLTSADHGDDDDDDKEQQVVNRQEPNKVLEAKLDSLKVAETNSNEHDVEASSNLVNKTKIIKQDNENCAIGDENAANTTTRTDKNDGATCTSKQEIVQESPNNEKKPTMVNKKDTIYHVKWIKFHYEKIPIILQNENGPCPLISIANVLFLRQNLKLDPNVTYLTSDELISYLDSRLCCIKPSDLNDEMHANFEKNLSDARCTLSKLESGLDVNVRFTHVNDFEYTEGLNVFDLFHINLYHSWLVDPQQRELANIIKKMSYNQLLDRIIHLKNSDSDVDKAQALLVEDFLDSTASQITIYGLIELQHVLKENELAIFFRNNHFNTIYKHEQHLYSLVTDQGFINRPDVVWETLSNIDGDVCFCDSSFNIYREVNGTQTAAASNDTSNDYYIAQHYDEFNKIAPTNMTDEEYARMLHEEEELIARKQQQQPQQQQQQQQQRMRAQQGNQLQYNDRERRKSKKEKKDSCSIL